MNILLISGHTSGYNKTKTGSRNEGDLNIELLNLIKPRLSKYANVYVYVYDTKRNAYYDCQNGVFEKHLPDVKIDYVLEIHFNATNGNAGTDGRVKGSEIFVTTREKGITVEQAIMKRMNKFFSLRDNDGVFDGVKRTNFLVINTLKNMGISGALLETCFYDDEDDMKVYYANKEAIADGIVEGIVEGFGLKKSTSTNTTKPTQPATKYYKKYTGSTNSIVDALKSVGVSATYDFRVKIAKANGIKNYEGSASQNSQMLKLLKQGKLKKV